MEAVSIGTCAGRGSATHRESLLGEFSSELRRKRVDADEPRRAAGALVQRRTESVRFMGVVTALHKNNHWISIIQRTWQTSCASKPLTQYTQVVSSLVGSCGQATRSRVNQAGGGGGGGSCCARGRRGCAPGSCPARPRVRSALCLSSAVSSPRPHPPGVPPPPGQFA